MPQIVYPGQLRGRIQQGVNYGVVATKGVKVDAKDLSNLLLEYSKIFNKALPMVIKDNARWLCQDLCDFTPPFSGDKPSPHKGGEGGFGLQARNKGRAAVRRDIHSIFRPLHDASPAQIAEWGNSGIFEMWAGEKMQLPEPHYPQWIFDLIKKHGMVTESTFAQFKAIEATKSSGSNVRAKYIVGGDDGQIKAYHEKRRGEPNYYITKKTRGNEYSGKAKSMEEITYIDDWKAVKNYINKVSMRVGKLKAGWYYCGKQLGYMPDSAWIENQGSSNGHLWQFLDRSPYYVEIGNSIAKRHDGGWYSAQSAIAHRHFALRNDIAINMVKANGAKGQRIFEAMLRLNTLASQSRKTEPFSIQ
jgi:hypothetical protein